MTEKDKAENPAIFVSNAGAPDGMANVHDQSTGTTIMVEATQEGILAGIHEINNR